MSGLRGKCIDTSNSINLDTDTLYYLWEHNSCSYYVSKFNKRGSHFGAYQKARFVLVSVEEEELTSDSLFELPVEVKEENKSTKHKEFNNQLSLFDL